MHFTLGSTALEINIIIWIFEKESGFPHWIGTSKKPAK